MARSKKKPRSTSATNPFDAFEKDYPPYLLKQLANPPKPTGENANANVVHLLIHKEECPYNDNMYEVKGVFSSVSPANQIILKIFKEAYNHYLSPHQDWDHFHPAPLDMYDMNQIGWEISKWGGLTLEAIDGGDGDKYRVYVETHVILNDIPEDFEFESESEPGSEPGPESEAKPVKKRKLKEEPISDEEDEGPLSPPTFWF